MKCKKCGAELKERVTFCRECGAKVEPDKPKISFCRECGSKLEDEAIFCSTCGAKVGKTFDFANDAANESNGLTKEYNERTEGDDFSDVNSCDSDTADTRKETNDDKERQAQLHIPYELLYTYYKKVDAAYAKLSNINSSSKSTTIIETFDESEGKNKKLAYGGIAIVIVVVCLILVLKSCTSSDQEKNTENEMSSTSIANNSNAAMASSVDSKATSSSFSSTDPEEIKEEMQDMANSIASMYGDVYGTIASEYIEMGKDVVDIYSGTFDSFIDSFKESAGLNGDSTSKAESSKSNEYSSASASKADTRASSKSTATSASKSKESAGLNGGFASKTASSKSNKYSSVSTSKADTGVSSKSTATSASKSNDEYADQIAYARKLNEYTLYYLFKTDTKVVFYFSTNDGAIYAGKYTGSLDDKVTMSFPYSGGFSETMIFESGTSFATLIDSNGFDWKYNLANVRGAYRVIEDGEHRLISP